MIYTSYYGYLRHLPSTLACYQISNSAPAGIQLPKLKEFVPPWPLVKAYKQTGDWAEFSRLYVRFLDRLCADDVFHILPTGDCVLLCYERDPSVCHRSLLAEWLKTRFNIEAREWGSN